MVARNCRHKRIKLSQGRFALVDAEDFEFLRQFSWYASWQPDAGTFVARATVNGKRVLMHRLIMKAPNGKEVDHANHKTLDNRKLNLRLCTRVQNCQNARLRRTRTLGKYKGVYKQRDREYWRAEITVCKKTIALGSFATERQGAAAYNKAAKKYHGEFACLNVL